MDFLAPEAEPLVPRDRWYTAGKIVSAALAARREGRVAFWKKRAFPLPTPVAREDARDLPLRGYLPRDKDDERRRRYQREREETKKRERESSGDLDGQR